MGEMIGTKFSWWRRESSNILFGCLACYPSASATSVLAIEDRNGYSVFRSTGDLNLYKHAEKFVGADTRRLIKLSGRKAGIDIDDKLEWRLLYCSNDNDATAKTPKHLLNALGEQKLESEVLAPPVFRGMTTKLYKSAVAVSGGKEYEIARKVRECVEQWSDYVKSHYPEWITVKDSSCGPVWVEGFDGEGEISFGFLEFLTEALVLRNHRLLTDSCKLSKYEDVHVLRELQSVTAHGKVVERILATERFGTGDNNDEWKSLTRRDVVRFAFCGSFSKCFLSNGPWSFLAKRAKGYWTTIVFCRGAKMQIRFTNLEEIRIAQRTTELGDCTGVGFVRPDDHKAVMSISEECDMRSRRGMTVFWKDMSDTTTREEMLHVFSNSMSNWNGKEMLLVDMTIRSVGEEDSELQAENVERMFDELRRFESGETHRQCELRGLRWARRLNYFKYRDALRLKASKNFPLAGRMVEMGAERIRRDVPKVSLKVKLNKDKEEGPSGGG